MKKRSVCLTLLCLCLTALLTGCFYPFEELFSRVEDRTNPPEEFENTIIIIGGTDATVGQYPEASWKPETQPQWTEPAETQEVFVELPNGNSVPDKNVQILEDGTVVAFTGNEPTGHMCFFTDGTYAYTHYYNFEGDICTYSAAAGIYVEWFLQSGSTWKEESYDVLADKTLFLIYREEREYAQLDIGIEESPWYHSATNELWYDSELDEYRTARSEFDPIYGSEKPIKCTYYDGSYSEHQYNLDGSQKKSTYYSEYGSVTQADFFENGQMTTQYLFREDGSQQFVTHYKDGEITSEIYYGAGGSYYDITYYKNGYRSYTLGHYDDGRTSSTYYDEMGCAIKFLSNAADGSLEWYVLYENYPDGNVKKATYYDASGQVTDIEEYDNNGN